LLASLAETSSQPAGIFTPRRPLSPSLMPLRRSSWNCASSLAPSSWVKAGSASSDCPGARKTGPASAQASKQRNLSRFIRHGSRRRGRGLGFGIAQLAQKGQTAAFVLDPSRFVGGGFAGIGHHRVQGKSDEEQAEEREGKRRAHRTGRGRPDDSKNHRDEAA